MKIGGSARPTATLGRHGTQILVVEDEMLIRFVVSDDLREAGYGVIEAFNGDEALAILRSDIPIDLIISDVRMPGSLDGMGLLAIVRAEFPNVPVIITSGHLDGSVAVAGGAACFIAKPYSSALIQNAVRNELRGSNG